MRILLADKQDITRAGLMYIINSMENVEYKYIEDKAELFVALNQDQDCILFTVLSRNYQYLLHKITLLVRIPMSRQLSCHLRL